MLTHAPTSAMTTFSAANAFAMARIKSASLDLAAGQYAALYPSRLLARQCRGVVRLEENRTTQPYRFHGIRRYGRGREQSAGERAPCHAALPLTARERCAISSISLADSRKSAAPMTPSTCLGDRIPTMAAVTSGRRSVHARATSPGVRLWRFADAAQHFYQIETSLAQASHVNNRRTKKRVPGYCGARSCGYGCRMVL